MTLWRLAWSNVRQRPAVTPLAIVWVAAATALSLRDAGAAKSLADVDGAVAGRDALLVVGAGLFVATTLSLSTALRRRELAVLRILGATAWELAVMVGLEAFLQLGLGVGLGFLLAVVAERIEPVGVHADSMATDWAVMIGIVGIGLAFAIAPAWNAARSNIAKR